MITPCSMCKRLFETSFEDASTPGVTCADCYRRGKYSNENPNQAPRCNAPVVQIHPTPRRDDEIASLRAELEQARNDYDRVCAQVAEMTARARKAEDAHIREMNDSVRLADRLTEQLFRAQKFEARAAVAEEALRVKDALNEELRKREGELLARAEKAEAELDEANQTLELIHAADLRAIEAWSASHPDHGMTFPGRERLVAWLLERLSGMTASRDRLAKECDAWREYWTARYGNDAEHESALDVLRDARAAVDAAGDLKGGAA